VRTPLAFVMPMPAPADIEHQTGIEHQRH
jgi:hypothetical protein